MSAREHEVDEAIRLRTANEVPEQVYLSQLQAAVAFDAEARVAAVSARTLVLSGDEDVIVPVQNSRNLSARIPGSELRILAGGSHAFFIEQADKFNQIVTQFIKKGLGT